MRFGVIAACLLVVCVVVTGLTSKHGPIPTAQHVSGLKKAVSPAPAANPQHATEGPGSIAGPQSTSPRAHVDYQSLSRPALLRNQMSPTEVPLNTTNDIDYLDIPTFLRQEKAEQDATQ